MLLVVFFAVFVVVVVVCVISCAVVGCGDECCTGGVVVVYDVNGLGCGVIDSNDVVGCDIVVVFVFAVVAIVCYGSVIAVDG